MNIDARCESSVKRFSRECFREVFFGTVANADVKKPSFHAAKTRASKKVNKSTKDFIKSSLDMEKVLAPFLLSERTKNRCTSQGIRAGILTSAQAYFSSLFGWVQRKGFQRYCKSCESKWALGNVRQERLESWLLSRKCYTFPISKSRRDLRSLKR